MRKLIVYNDNEVIYVGDEASVYNSTKEGEFILVQTLHLAKKMLQARGINTSIFNHVS